MKQLIWLMIFFIYSTHSWAEGFFINTPATKASENSITFNSPPPARASIAGSAHSFENHLSLLGTDHYAQTFSQSQCLQELDFHLQKVDPEKLKNQFLQARNIRGRNKDSSQVKPYFFLKALPIANGILSVTLEMRNHSDSSEVYSIQTLSPRGGPKGHCAAFYAVTNRFPATQQTGSDNRSLSFSFQVSGFGTDSETVTITDSETVYSGN